MIYMVCYDIYNNKRRYKVERVLKGYGVRIQHSLFECSITEGQLNALRRRLERIINPEEFDSIRFYSLCKHCYSKVEYFGIGIKIDEEDYYLH